MDEFLEFVLAVGVLLMKLVAGLTQLLLGL